MTTYSDFDGAHVLTLSSFPDGKVKDLLEKIGFKWVSCQSFDDVESTRELYTILLDEVLPSIVGDVTNFLQKAFVPNGSRNFFPYGSRSSFPTFVNMVKENYGKYYNNPDYLISIMRTNITLIRTYALCFFETVENIDWLICAHPNLLLCDPNVLMSNILFLINKIGKGPKYSLKENGRMIATFLCTNKNVLESSPLARYVSYPSQEIIEREFYLLDYSSYESGCINSEGKSIDGINNNMEFPECTDDGAAGKLKGLIGKSNMSCYIFPANEDYSEIRCIWGTYVDGVFYDGVFLPFGTDVSEIRKQKKNFKNEGVNLYIQRDNGIELYYSGETLSFDSFFFKDISLITLSPSVTFLDLESFSYYKDSGKKLLIELPSSQYYEEHKECINAFCKKNDFIDIYYVEFTEDLFAEGDLIKKIHIKDIVDEL